MLTTNANNSDLNVVRNNKVPSTFSVQVWVLQETWIPDVLGRGHTSFVETLDDQNVEICNHKEEQGNQVYPETHEEYVI